MTVGVIGRGGQPIANDDFAWLTIFDCSDPRIAKMLFPFSTNVCISKSCDEWWNSCVSWRNFVKHKSQEHMLLCKNTDQASIRNPKTGLS